MLKSLADIKICWKIPLVLRSWTRLCLTFEVKSVFPIPILTPMEHPWPPLQYSSSLAGPELLLLLAVSGRKKCMCWVLYYTYFCIVHDTARKMYAFSYLRLVQILLNRKACARWSNSTKKTFAIRYSRIFSAIAIAEFFATVQLSWWVWLNYPPKDRVKQYFQNWCIILYKTIYVIQSDFQECTRPIHLETWWENLREDKYTFSDLYQ